ncbi:hypothetical protein CHLRE_07g328800v5 [Chlamydomonas reinhardtii]|uniref:NSG13 protein n=1 Tax=Chlamydomonas reinhardtii TaxID=3055 RepID=Q65Z17_CHLRE|nr:uncharacterized protein CHLRE_07g328800v5 [Chlamydomonas reinhardtii]PNW80763.1 hypothetical protein CHLRE_07g328800v5 [Chlamydomonas reinhardtii]BAD44755.1 NSG13 protein [Chlamydomonas reinhardtii]|eukprot:XP_001690645.1 nitrogen-starved gametogenesis 13 [Chlamydomonas reinhardtii]
MLRRAQAPAVPAADCSREPAEVSKQPRGRRVSRSPSLSSASSDVEPGSPCPVAQPQPIQPRQSVVIDHPGATRVLQKPDGTIVFEAAESDGGAAGGGAAHGSCRVGHPGAHLVRDLAAAGGVLLMAGASAAGLIAAREHSAAAAAGSYCLTTKQLSGVVAHAVSAYVAGTATGLVVGPLLAARAVAGVLLRPALVGLVVATGIRKLGSWRCGVSGLIRKLASADPGKVMEALRAIIAAAKRGSPRFAREFNRLKGMEALLQRLSLALPDCALLHMIAQALAELCKDQECRDSLVAAGGVPRLVGLLQHPDPAVSGCGLAALSRLADHSLAVEAIREAGGLTRLVELTAAASDAVVQHSAAAALAAAGAAPPPPQAAAAAAPVGATATFSGGPGSVSPAASVAGGAAGSSSNSSNGSAASSMVPAAATATAGGYDRRAMLLPAVKLLQALSLDPASKAAIGAAGGVSILLDVVARSAPRSEAQGEAIGALHNSLRGCPDNQRLLASLPAASEVLRAALAGYGPCWAPAKADLHALLNVLARLQGVQEAGGFVVVQSQVAAAAAKAAEAATAGASGAAVPATPVPVAAK